MSERTPDSGSSSSRQNTRLARYQLHTGLLVHRRCGIEQQADQVPDLLGGQRAGIAEARHRRAQVEGLGIEDFAVDVALRLRAVAAKLAEIAQAGADRAVGGFARCELVTVVA